MILLGAGVIASQLFKDKPAHTDRSKNFRISDTRSINASLIDGEGRYGILFLFRNNGEEDWAAGVMEISCGGAAEI